MPTPDKLPTAPPRLLLYGASGAGKSALVMTAGENVQMMVTDPSGWSVASAMKDSFREQRMKVDIINCNESPGAPGSGFAKVKEHIFRVIEQVKKGEYKFKILAVDSLTSWSEQGLRYVSANSGFFMPNGDIRMQYKNSTPFTGRDKAHYGAIMQEIQNQICLLESLPCAVVLIAHQTVDRIELPLGGTKDTITPNIIGQALAPWVLMEFFETWYIDQLSLGGSQTKRVVKTLKNPGLEAKSRGELPDNTPLSDGFPAMLERIGYKI